MKPVLGYSFISVHFLKSICPKEVIKIVIRNSLLVIGTALLLAGCFHKGKPQDLGLPETGEGIKIEDQISELGKQFGVTIPEDVDKVILESTVGDPASGLATRDRQDPATLTILANLPESKLGYSARLTEGDKKFELGNLVVTKGGWMVEKTLNQEAAGFHTVEVLAGPTIVLEGQFEE
jgi:hypothetical protein